MKNYFFAILATLFVLTGCQKEVEVNSIELNQISSEIYLGSTLQLEAKVSPSDAEVNVLWTSSDKSIATVDQNGLVETLSLGKVDITATAGSVSAKCEVSVVEIPPVLVEEIVLNKTELNLYIGDVFELVATIKPEDAENKEITWESSERAIAKVDKYGKVLGVGEGTAVITAKAGDVKAECTVTVSQVPVESVNLNETSIEMMVDESFKLIATVLPENAADKTVYWSTSNEEIATVDIDGNVTGMSIGEAVITATAGGVKAECKVKIDPVPVSGIALDNTALEMMIGDIVELAATVYPENASNKEVRWTSSDASTVSVDNGTLQAYQVGTATITASIESFAAECVVTVSTVEPKIGDYFYSDGTYSSVLDGSKEVVGLIFYLGDATASDPALKAAYPQCTNGLVMSIRQIDTKLWQENSSDYKAATKDTFNGHVGKWIEANTSYISCQVDSKESKPHYDNYNTILGYNNTLGIGAFNADPANAGWLVNVYEDLVAFRSQTAVPEGASEWYIPSVKELSLMCTGEYDGHISKIGSEEPPLVEIKDKLNKQLGNLTDAPLFIEDSSSYWSSSEDDGGYAYKLLFKNGKSLYQQKNSSTMKYDIHLRFVFAF